MHPLISVVVPVYNASDFLEECIKSILSQTYQNLQLILIDDGSTDRSADIINKYKLKDKRVVAIKQINNGVSSARNSGINNAKGDYIMFVDSDDTVSPDIIQSLLRDIQTTSADVATCQLYSNNQRTHSTKTAPSVVSGVKCAEKLLYQSRVVAGPYCKLIPRTIYKSFYFDENTKFAEDLEYTFNVILASNTVSISGNEHYFYRIHDKSVMHREFTNDRLDGMKACMRIVDSSKKDASLLSAANNRLFMEAVYILLAIINAKAKYVNYKKECWAIIKKYRSGIILDNKNTFKYSKMNALLSFLGLSIFSIVHRLNIGINKSKAL